MLLKTTLKLGTCKYNQYLSLTYLNCVCICFISEKMQFLICFPFQFYSLVISAVMRFMVMRVQSTDFGFIPDGIDLELL